MRKYCFLIRGKRLINKVKRFWRPHGDSNPGSHRERIGLQSTQAPDSNGKLKRGEWLRKLSNEDILYIRSSPLSTLALAEKFGLHVTTIRRARHGHTFSDHPAEPHKLKRGGWSKADLPCTFRPETFALPGEEWRSAVGWELHYRVSNLGRVYSLHQTGRLVVGMCVNDSYRILKVRSEGRKANLPVHCMVLEAFVGPRPSPNHEGCHNNGKPEDNRLDNLRWDTAAANQADRKLHGTTRSRGTDALTPEIVHRIRTNPEVTLVEWAQEFGVSRTCVAAARAGRTWKDVPTPPLLKMKRSSVDSGARP